MSLIARQKICVLCGGGYWPRDFNESFATASMCEICAAKFIIKEKDMFGDDKDKACGGACKCNAETACEKHDELHKGSNSPRFTNEDGKLVDRAYPIEEVYEDAIQEIARLREGKFNLTGHEDIDVFLRECMDTMSKKGHDYRQGNDEDILHNFRTVASSVGSTMEKVWFTYFYKHYSAMVTFIKEGGQSESEPIEGRIKDQIVYLLLFYQMVRERKANTPGIQRAKELVAALDRKDATKSLEKQAHRIINIDEVKREILQESSGLAMTTTPGSKDGGKCE